MAEAELERMLLEQ